MIFNMGTKYYIDNICFKWVLNESFDDHTDIMKNYSQIILGDDYNCPLGN